MITLIRHNGVPVTVGVDRNSFAIENGKVVEDSNQRHGAEYNGVISLKVYEANLQLAQWAWENQLFDEEIDNR